MVNYSKTLYSTANIRPNLQSTNKIPQNVTFWPPHHNHSALSITMTKLLNLFKVIQPYFYNVCTEVWHKKGKFCRARSVDSRLSFDFLFNVIQLMQWPWNALLNMIIDYTGHFLWIVPHGQIYLSLLWFEYVRTSFLTVCDKKFVGVISRTIF